MNTKTRLSLALGTLLLAGFASLSYAQTAYRWVDAQGRVHFSDQPPPNTQNVETKNYSPNQNDPTLPYTLRKVAADFPVVLFTAPDCSYCDEARTLLTQRGIPFSEQSLTSQETADSYEKRFGTRDIPTMTIGNTVTTGFEAGRWNGLLDNVGYPKTPPK